MTAKYRIKLKTGRVVGPFVVTQIGELYLKGHITGEEQGQEFPVGDWLPLSDHKEIKSLLTKIISQDLKLKDLQDTQTHTIAKLSAAKKAKREKEFEDNQPSISKHDYELQEFKFGKSEGPEVDYEELEEKYKKRKEEEELEQQKKLDEEKRSNKKANIEATQIIRRPEIKNVDKTVIVKKNDPPEVKSKQVEESENLIQEGSENDNDHSEDENEKSDEVSSDEKTEFFNIDSAVAGLRVATKVAEKEFEEQSRALEDASRGDFHDTYEAEEDSDEDDESDLDESKNKRIKPITIIIVAALIFFILMPEEEKEIVIKPVPLEVTFPVAKEFKDEVKSEREFKKGEESFAKGTYADRLEAKEHYVKSLQHKFKDNPAMARLLYIYAYDYKNVSDKLRADKNIFRLVKLNDSRVLTDDQIAVATALFYFNNDKDLTALKTIENYLRVSKPSEIVYAVYVDILMKNGRYDQARKVLETLEDIDSKRIDSYLAIANFYHIDQRFDKGLEVIDEGLKEKPKSVALLIKKSALLLAREDFSKLEATLEEIKILYVEDSPYYYSKYLEYKGVLSAVRGNQGQATKFFNSALSYFESDELRSMLSQADVKGEDASKILILESKVIELMGRAKEKFRKRNWDMALSLAIEAADLMPNYIPAQMMLVEIQSERGFFEPALENLNRLRDDFPINTSINYALVRTYLKSHRIEDAERELAIMGNTEFALTPEYAMAMAEYYEQVDNMRLSIRFYNEAIDRNPLNDINYYELAKIFLEYKRFERSKQMILEAISLDPTNVYYHSIYASILYETQTSDAAIGYLRGVLERNEDHPKILGDIAIYYYRLGKINEFNEYKKRIEDLNRRDQSFYEFLVESSRLRGEEKAVVDYSKELIKVNPGNLEVRMELGQYLLKRGYHKDALDEFQEVVDRLATYPGAHYYMAKCHIVDKDYDLALEHADKEIEGNPTLDTGYYIKGEVQRLQGNYQESVKMLEKAISINGQSVEALLALGWIKMRQNYLDTARELYLRALKRDPSIPDIHLQLGHIYRSSGQGKLAIDSYETYLKLYPNAPDKRKIQNLMRQLR